MHNTKKIYTKIMMKGGELNVLTGELEAVRNAAQTCGRLPDRLRMREEKTQVTK